MKSKITPLDTYEESFCSKRIGIFGIKVSMSLDILYHVFPCLLTIILLSMAGNAIGQTNFTVTGNPLFKNAFTADPAPLVYGDKLYVYVGHDEATGNQLFNITEWLCYSTTDMVNWQYHGPIMKPTDFSWAVGEAWASQVVAKDGKFYFYTTVQAGHPNTGKAIGVAVSDSPLGPFKDARGSALVYDRDTPTGDVWDDIDPTVWIDDDGTGWLVWGNPNTFIAKLKPNMIEIDGKIEELDLPYYAEGPWLWKRNGLYYIMYPAFVPPVTGEQLCYATATNVKGPYTYHGVISPSAQNSYTTHPGVIEFKGQWYMFYHNATLTLNGLGPATGRRSVTAEHMCYNEDGTIKYMPHTSKGITLPPPCPPSGNPLVEITSPANGTAFSQISTISIAVNASDYDGVISKVEFFNGSTKLGEDITSPYNFTWANATIGTHTIRAIATDNQGNTTESKITIKVNVPKGPYNGTWHTIPGTIQFEHFDVGGNGFAYMDDSPGSEVSPTVDFRTGEDVDIENCTDVGAGYNIGFATAGEWLEYSVDVEKPGTYDLDLRVAADGTDRTVFVTMDGATIANNIAIPNTGGWQTWQTITINNINLKAGKQNLRLTIGATDYVNLSYATFNLIKELKQEAYKGIALQIPGRIEAEHYDLGGEGLAFHEVNNGNEGGADYRNDEVDIEETQDTDGEYNIAYIMQDEWLEYTVNVTTDGIYNLDLRMAADGDNKTLHIEIDGNDITGAINVPNTGGWQAWQTVTVNEINLSAGEHIIRIAFDASYMNLNYIEFRSLVTSLNQSSSEGFRVFPNPFSNRVSIEYQGSFTFQITTLSGKVIEEGVGKDRLELDYNDFEQGVFLVVIKQNGNIQTTRLVKE